MDINVIRDLSYQLKDIAKDLSFLGHPRYPLKDLYQLFPQHRTFIDCLEDVSVPFPVNVAAKRKSMDEFRKKLAVADITFAMKAVFSQRLQDYGHLLTMMENFGNHKFYEHTVHLYGTARRYAKNHAFPYFLDQIPSYLMEDTSLVCYRGKEAINYMGQKLAETFNPNDFEVKPSSSLLSDSSAGRRVVKLNPHKLYTTRYLDIFVVHEGWVHLGTSLNGAAQADHPWLSTWAPRTTFLQEGLAILVELITGNMTLKRWNRVILRHIATSMAERGSSIREVYHFFIHGGMEELDAFKLTLRVFRGVPFEGGMAFTKELLYLHGMVEILYHLHFYKTSLKSMWVGKVSFDEHLLLMDKRNGFELNIKYFPKALEHPVTLARLEKLKELSFSLFKHGFL